MHRLSMMSPTKPARVGPINGSLTSLVARTGRHHQRYEHGYRLVAGCVPFRYCSDSTCSSNSQHKIEVLMVTTQGGPGLLFPKGGWETDETVEEAACREAYEEAGVHGQLKGCLGSWDFRSKPQKGGCNPKGLTRAYMFALAVTKELESWPEEESRQRRWISVAEAVEHCRYEWMQKVLAKCISYLNTSSLVCDDTKETVSPDASLPYHPVQGP